MGAPAVTTRVQPPHGRLEDGYISKIAFSQDPDIDLYEKTVQPPGWDGGEPIDTTTMWNQAVRTFSPRALKSMTGGTVNCGYNPLVLQQLQAIINVRGSMTFLWPDGEKVSFFAYVQKAEPDALEEGAMPMMNVTYVVTNYDPVNKVEALPVHTPATGTGS